jgi:hypothetical protein
MKEPSSAGGKPKTGKQLTAVAVGFGLFHSLSLVLAIFPRDWAGNRILAPYRQLTGTEQEWGMFYTIPTMQENAIAVEITDASGASSERGPILPGLRPYRTHAQIRYYYLLNRLTDHQQPYLGAYVKGLGEEVMRLTDGGASEFAIRMESEYIRLLERIDEDGEMTLLKSETLGPFLLGGE